MYNQVDATFIVQRTNDQENGGPCNNAGLGLAFPLAVLVTPFVVVMAVRTQFFPFPPFGRTSRTRRPPTTKMRSSFPPCCPVCYEASPDSDGKLWPLPQCRHAICRGCLVQWIETVEASGNVSRSPGCPVCTTALTQDEMQSILGRPFVSATSQKSATTAMATGEGMDDFTRQLLDETTRPCPHCGAHIEKVPGTCDKMECLCGYQFCYQCGARGARCGCTVDDGDPHWWYDNVRHGPNDDHDFVAQRDARTGQFDLKKRIRNLQRDADRGRQRDEFQTVHPLHQRRQLVQWLQSLRVNGLLGRWRRRRRQHGVVVRTVNISVPNCCLPPILIRKHSKCSPSTRKWQCR
jgi:hypothetical protein